MKTAGAASNSESSLNTRRSALGIGLRRVMGDPVLFSQHVIGQPLRPYQAQPMQAALDSIGGGRGRTLTVMFARQMGKNELSAHLECFLLNLHQRRGGTIVKTAPTYQPQTINSKLRLLATLENPLNQGQWWVREGYMVGLGKAACLFVSGNEEARVVGLTASLLLEVDEAQDMDEAKYQKDFRPMASSTNATTVLYGTAWTGDTLLEKQAALNRDLEGKDGVRRHFQYDWQTLAALSPAYRAFVEAERLRLGEDHPLFRTQYKLESLAQQAGFLSAQQRAQMVGDHPRQHQPQEGKEYVAGVDLAGEDEEAADAALRAAKPRRDSVVVTIAEVDYQPVTELLLEPRLRIVEHYWWTGRKHRDLYATLVDVLGNVWGCKRVAADASGVGAGVASFLAGALGASVVEQFVFSARSKSDLGYALLAAVNGGRVKMYRESGTGCRVFADGTGEGLPASGFGETNPVAEFWREMKLAQYTMRANQTLGFYVPEKDGHDDFLMSLALCVRAGQGCVMTPASALAAPPRVYDDGWY